MKNFFMKHLEIIIKILGIGWIATFLIIFVGSILSMFPGGKMGEKGYEIYVALTAICWDLAIFLLPFFLFIGMDLFASFKKKKLTKRRKREYLRSFIRFFTVLYIYSISILLLLVSIMMLIQSIDKIILLPVSLFMGFTLLFELKTFREYCKTNPVKRPSILIILPIFELCLCIGAIFLLKMVVLDHPYLDNPRTIALSDIKVVRNTSSARRPTQPYYEVSGIDSHGESHTFDFDFAIGKALKEENCSKLQIFYLPYTGVVMDYK